MRLRPGEIVVDNYAGGGGASEGMEIGLDQHVDIAINHDPVAIEMHKMNHPETKHYCESVWDVDPVEACEGRPVGLAWFSPDCRHFSKAKGGTPVKQSIRGLAWVAVRWAALVPVRVMMLENVEEFKTWGPLIEVEPGVFKPDPDRKGEYFNGFVEALTTGMPVNSPVWKDVYMSLFQNCFDIDQKLKIYKSIKHGLGNKLQYDTLHACDYGTPTTRKRLFLIARNDGEAIEWPEKTHGDSKEQMPFKTAADIIDWGKPTRSIFNRSRPLAEKTMKRIAKGLEKFVFNAENPFIIPAEKVAPFITEHANASSQRNMPADEPLRTICAKVKGGHFAVVEPQLELVASAFIDRQFGKSRGNSVTDPLGTVTSGGGGKSALVTSHMIKFRGDNCGHATDEPVHTISAGGNHIGEVRAFLVGYYGAENTYSVDEPLRTVTTKERFGIVTIHGTEYQIVDIGMRMLEPSELFAAQGFRGSYKTSHDSNGKKLTKAQQVAKCGNAVCPPVAQALVEANFPKLQQMAA
jgi:DNA (cytosine-5)-methyltransferase 1